MYFKHRPYTDPVVGSVTLTYDLAALTPDPLNPGTDFVKPVVNAITLKIGAHTYTTAEVEALYEIATVNGVTYESIAIGGIDPNGNNVYTLTNGTMIFLLFLILLQCL